MTVFQDRGYASRNGNGPDESELIATPASGITAKNVRWAWQGWMPLGMLSLLVGLPGRGKTTLAEQLSADITRGELAGDLHGNPADVLMVSYEDSVEHTLVPRLMAAEADLDRVHLLGCSDKGRSLDLSHHLPSIERIAKSRQARLLVVDPLVAGLSRENVNSHRDQDVRSVLAPLAALAARCDLAVLATMHFSKSATSALIGAGGSIGFVGAARSILVFGVDPNDERGAGGPKRVLAHAKCNVSRLQKSRGLDLVEHVIDPFGSEPIVTSRVELGGQSDVSADDLVREDDRTVSPRVQAERFLRELLADGPHRASEVFDLAEDADIAVKTLKRAKKDLGIDSFQRKAPDGKREWWWVVPEEEPPPGEEPVEDEEEQ